MPTGILELAMVILIATVLGMVAKFLRQPLILAFILSGVVIGYFGLLHLNNKEVLQIFSDLGIMLLLFLVGLEIDVKSLKLIGKTSVFVGLVQIAGTFGLGLLISRFLHFGYLQSIYLSTAFVFSSTIIAIKLLSEKQDSNSLYGKIATGILLTQDFFAVLVLVVLSGVQAGQGIVLTSLLFAVLKGIFLFAVILLVGKRLIPWIFDKIAYSQELLFIGSLGWCFLLGALVSNPKIGFPLEVSGLLAGLALANSSENYQIFTKIKYLRDFFAVMFFVILGLSMTFTGAEKMILPIIIFSVFVLFVKPFIVFVTMSIMGYRSKTSFMSGATIAHISEFSLVLAAIGFKAGHLSQEVASIITAVGIVSFASSSYIIIFSNNIFEKISPLLSVFQRKKLKEKFSSDHGPAKPYILIGSHRLGQSIAFSIKKEDLLIIDFDPQVIHEIKPHGYDYLFGDVDDEEIFNHAHFDKAKAVISTVPDFKDNMILLKKLNVIKNEGHDLKIIMRAESETEMGALYKEGADYVIFPYFTSGYYFGKSISVDPEMKILESLKNLDIKTISKLDKHKRLGIRS